MNIPALRKMMEESTQVVKTLGQRIQRHKDCWHNQKEPACRILEDEYKKLEVAHNNLSALLDVVEAARELTKWPYPNKAHYEGFENDWASLQKALQRLQESE